MSKTAIARRLSAAGCNVVEIAEHLRVRYAHVRRMLRPGGWNAGVRA